MYNAIEHKIYYKNEKYKILKCYFPTIAKEEIYTIFKIEEENPTQTKAISGYYNLKDAIKTANYLMALNKEKSKK